MTSEYYKNFNPFEDKKPIVETIDEAIQSDTLKDSIVESVKDDVMGYVFEEENLLPQVAASVGNFNSEPVLSVPFNDSGKIERGFGTFDQIDVSAAQDGSIMVDLPSKSVDFTCDAVRYGINKSGVLQEYAANEIMFGTDGAILGHDAYTNYCLQNQDLTVSPWAGTATVSTSSELSCDLSTYMYEVTDDDAANNENIYQAISASFTAGGCISINIKNKDALYTRFSIQDGGVTYNISGIITWDGLEIESIASVGTTLAYFEYEKAANDSYIVYIYTQVSLGTMSSGRFYCWPAGFISGGAYTGSVYLAHPCVNNIGYPAPITKTEATAVSVPAAITSIPVMNNLPAPGEPFTIELDIELSTLNLNYEKLVYIGDAANSLYFAYDNAGAIYIGIITDKTTYTTGKLPAYDGLSKMFVVYDGESVTIINNTTGDNVSVAVNGTPTYLDSDNIYLCTNGRTMAQFISEPIRNFKIYHKALSAKEIASKGAA